MAENRYPEFDNTQKSIEIGYNIAYYRKYTGLTQEQLAERVGIKVRTGVKIDRIEGQERVTAVRLADGEEIAANLVLISCGVRANTELAEQMGL